MILKEKMATAANYLTVDETEDFRTMQVCNNCVWTFGEIAVKVPESFKPYLIEVMDTLVTLLN